MFLDADLRREVFLNEFPQFSIVDTTSINQLIKIYDKNLAAAKQHSQPHLVVIGSIVTIYAWIYLNSASVHYLDSNLYEDGRLVIINTILSMACSGIIYFLMALVDARTKVGRMVIF